jgi:hypothetical protein
VFVVIYSSKHGDLERDGRYALHAIPAGSGQPRASSAGERVPSATRPSASAPAASGRHINDWETLFVFDIEKALGTSWANWGTDRMPWPTFTRWKQGKGMEVQAPPAP